MAKIWESWFNVCGAVSLSSQIHVWTFGPWEDGQTWEDGRERSVSRRSEHYALISDQRGGSESGGHIRSVKPEAQDAVDDAQVGRSFATCLHCYKNTFSLLISSKLTMSTSVLDIKVTHAKYHAVSSLCYSYSILKSTQCLQHIVRKWHQHLMENIHIYCFSLAFLNVYFTDLWKQSEERYDISFLTI